MSITQASYLTVERSLYPKRHFFKPKVVAVDSIAGAVRAYDEVMKQHVPQTKQDADYDRKAGWPVREGHAGDDFDDESTADWKQVGRYWVRQTEGPHPHCWTNSRVGATVNWRTSPGSYCCDGFPFFHEKSMEKFRRTMEMVKPLIRFNLKTLSLTLCLERDLEGPIGTCWGIKTKSTYLRFVESMGDYFKRDRIALTKAAVNREFLDILG